MENSGIDFTVTIYRPGFGGMSVPSSQSDDIRRNILSSIESDPGITVSDLSNLLGIPQRTVEREISSLKREGTIHRTGSSRNGRWLVRRVS